MASFIVGGGISGSSGALLILTYKTFHSSSSSNVVQGKFGSDLEISVIKKMRQAIILMTVKYRISLSPLESLHSSTLMHILIQTDH